MASQKNEDDSSSSPKLACLRALDAANIVYELIEHAAAPTVDEHTKQLSEWVESRGSKAGSGSYGQVKNLVLKDKKGKMYLISCHKVYYCL